MKLKTINYTGTSDYVQMGPVKLKQPLPTDSLDAVDPFVLLHHYGPYAINAFNNPFDLGPHPHRGFEPITFLLQGEQKHRDSLGNESIVKGGDVQWTTAGRGIIHAEGPTKEFVEKGGTLEGIQLWLNLPANKKMIPAKYQHVKSDEFRIVRSDDKKIETKIVAGELEDTYGKIATETPVNAWMIHAEEGGETFFNVPVEHQSMLYLISGDVLINNSYPLKNKEDQLLTFNQDGDGFQIKANQSSTMLFLSGKPFHEKVTSWGPYVMNTQTEIMEALRDYQQGKMGYLSVSE